MVPLGLRLRIRGNVEADRDEGRIQPQPDAEQGDDRRQRFLSSENQQRRIIKKSSESSLAFRCGNAPILYSVKSNQSGARKIPGLRSAPLPPTAGLT